MKNVIKKWLSNKEKFSQQNPSLENHSNPYLQSRALWNDLYGSLQDKLQNAYRLIGILAMTIVISIVGLVIIAAESKVKPYVAVLHGNELLAMIDFDASESEVLKPKLAAILARQFIQNARDHSIDSAVNQQNYIATLAITTSNAMNAVKDFINVNAVDSNQVRHCQIKTLLIKSSHTVEIHWQEELRDSRSGDVVATQEYSADLTFQFTNPSEDAVIAQRNPLGFYITSFVWNKDLTSN